MQQQVQVATVVVVVKAFDMQLPFVADLIVVNNLTAAAFEYIVVVVVVAIVDWYSLVNATNLQLALNNLFVAVVVTFDVVAVVVELVVVQLFAWAIDMLAVEL